MEFRAVKPGDGRLRARIDLPGGRLIERLFLGPGDGVMVRRQLLGLRGRTARSSEIAGSRRWTPMRFMTFPALLLALALVVSACSGGSDEPEAAPSDDGEDAGAVERDVAGDESDADDATADASATTPDPAADAGPVPASQPQLAAQVAGDAITLSWASVDGLRWEIQRDGNDLDTVGQPSFTDAGLADGAYHYQVIAIGTDGDPVMLELD